MLKEFKGKELSRQSKYIYLVSQGFEQEEGLAGETQAKLGKVRQENGRSLFHKDRYNRQCVDLRDVNMRKEEEE